MYFGQFQTDRYISEYFEGVTNGTCIDVGMAEAIDGNNTFYFENKGWNCVCVEPNPNYCAAAKNIRKNVLNVACGEFDEENVDFEIFTVNGNNQGAISSLKTDHRLIESHKKIITGVQKIKIDVLTLNSVLERYKSIDKIDFVSIDTENTELSVLKGFDINKWKPKLFVIENNFNEPYLGDYLKDFGYKLDKRVEVNDFYLRID